MNTIAGAITHVSNTDSYHVGKAIAVVAVPIVKQVFRVIITPKITFVYRWKTFAKHDS